MMLIFVRFPHSPAFSACTPGSLQAGRVSVELPNWPGVRSSSRVRSRSGTAAGAPPSVSFQNLIVGRIGFQCNHDSLRPQQFEQKGGISDIGPCNHDHCLNQWPVITAEGHSTGAVLQPTSNLFRTRKGEAALFGRYETALNWLTKKGFTGVIHATQTSQIIQREVPVGREQGNGGVLYLHPKHIWDETSERSGTGTAFAGPKTPAQTRKHRVRTSTTCLLTLTLFGWQAAYLLENIHVKSIGAHEDRSIAASKCPATAARELCGGQERTNTVLPRGIDLLAGYTLGSDL